MAEIKDFEQHAKEWFDRAINCGFLSTDSTAKNYVHHYMFVGISNGFAMFKHLNLRNYITLSTVLLKEL